MITGPPTLGRLRRRHQHVSLLVRAVALALRSFSCFPALHRSYYSQQNENHTNSKHTFNWWSSHQASSTWCDVHGVRGANWIGSDGSLDRSFGKLDWKCVNVVTGCVVPWKSKCDISSPTCAYDFVTRFHTVLWRVPIVQGDRSSDLDGVEGLLTDPHHHCDDHENDQNVAIENAATITSCHWFASEGEASFALPALDSYAKRNNDPRAKYSTILRSANLYLTYVTCAAKVTGNNWSNELCHCEV